MFVYILLYDISLSGSSMCFAPECLKIYFNPHTSYEKN